MVTDLLFLTLGADAVATLVAVAFHHATLAATRAAGARSVRIPFLSFAFWVLVGAVVLWCLPGVAVPRALRAATLLLYAAGILCYMQVLSLLSRGYSLKILDDLHATGGRARMEDLKARYGDGMGIEGLLRKRVSGLRTLGFLEAGEDVGPLTATGRAGARFLQGCRALLRLENVG